MLMPIAKARQLNYVVFDLETTGLDPQSDSITQISAVRVRDGMVLNERAILEFLESDPFGLMIDHPDFFTSLIKINRQIPPNIIQMTGINDEMLKDAPEESQILRPFCHFIDGGVLVAHNGLTFDLLFLQEAAKRWGLPNPPTTCLDTLRVCRKIDLASSDVSYNLEASLQRHNIPLIPDLPLHNALVDALLTARLLTHFLHIMEKRETDGIFIL